MKLKILFTILIIYSTCFSQDKNSTWLGLLRADGIVVPFFYADSSKWSIKPKSEEFWSPGNPSIPHNWFIWYTDMNFASDIYYNYKPVQFNTGDALKFNLNAGFEFDTWGLVSNYSHKFVFDTYRSSYPTYGFVSNKKLNLWVFKKFDLSLENVNAPKISQFIGEIFYDFEIAIRKDLTDSNKLLFNSDMIKKPLLMKVYVANYLIYFEAKRDYSKSISLKIPQLQKKLVGWVKKTNSELTLTTSVAFKPRFEYQTREPLVFFELDQDPIIVMELNPYEGQNSLELYKFENDKISPIKINNLIDPPGKFGR